MTVKELQLEWQQHAPAALKGGLSPAAAEDIRLGREPKDLKDDERAVYAYAKELHETKTVSDATHAAATAVLAILVGFALMRGVLAADQGTASMIEIAKAIQEGAMAYLKRQFRTIALILIPVAAVVFLDETLAGYHYAGFACVGVGILLAAKR